MKIWYKAVCDEHKEMCDIFVDSPYRTNLYLGKYGEDIYQWLNLHYGCSLRMIHLDTDLDKCYNDNYIDVLLNYDNTRSHQS